KSFDEEGVKFVGSCKDKVGDGENLIRQGAKKEICGTEIAVRKINLERFAKISVSTNNKRMGGVVNFSYGIGIEKRAIELSPEKTSQRIANLNESIERWEDINDNLGSVVKGMKAACFATSAALQVKNLFSGMGGVAMARQAVMQGENGWNNFCDGWEKEGYVSSDDCYSKNGKAIESDVKTYASELEKINDAIEEIESGGGITEGGTFGKVVDSEKSKTEFFERFSGQMPDGVTAEVLSYEQMKDFVLYDGLKEEGSEQMNEDVKINLANLNSEVDDMIEYNKRQKQLKENVDSSGLSGVANIYAPIDDFTESRKTRPYQTLRVSEVNKFPGSSKGDDVAYVSIKTNNELKIYLVGLEDVGNQGEQYRIPHADAKVFEETGASWVKVENETVTNKIKAEYTGFRVVSSSTYSNEYKNPEVRYYESAQYKGVPAVVPFDLVNGWYAATQTTLPGFGNVPAFKESGQVSNFLLCNVGSNGKEQFPEMGDDECITINPYSGTSNMNFLGMSENKVRELSAKARSALKEAANQYKDGVRTVKISGKRLNVGNPAVAISGTRCQDFMSPADCKLLFNVCDPVICPSSRCDLGGKYHVDNVVQSGIVGSIFLCLPNIREGIAIPICLTGVHAGIENYVSILKASRSCLQENLDSGKYVGICDQITAVYKCEFFWNQISPLLNTLLPKLLEMAMGGGTRGGGEYMFVQSAWDNMQGSIDSFKQNYAINTIKSFNIRSTQEVGNEVCKSFISTRFPNSFKSLVEPDSPSQFTAWFDEIPMTTATTPSRSQYKVFYHIFAGEDQGSYYSVYLKDAPETSYYSSTGGQVVATGYINKGEYASESVDFEGVSGFQQLCVRVNYQEECGFKRVSTGFALNYLKDKYIEGQMTDTVKTQKECISGSSDGMAVLAGGLNPQALATESLQPEIYKRGIIRVCATSNPGAGADTNQWREVGYCDNKNLKCWLDTNSIEEAYTTGNYGARNRTTEALDEIAENLDNDIEIDIEGTVTDKVLKKIKEEIDRLKSSDNLLADARVVLAKIEGVRAKIVFSNQHALADYLEGRVYDVLARSAWKEVVAKRQVARAGETVSCEDLGGTWKGECEDNEVDKTSELNDESSTTENSNKKCCVLKEHGTQGENLPPDTMLASYVDPTPVNLGGLSDFEIVDALTFVMEYAKENPIEDGDGNSNNDRKCNCGDDCGKYAGWIVKHSEQNNINNPLLVLSLIMQESSCKAKGSSGSSVGLMQINLGYWCEEYGLPSDKTECKAKLIDFPEKNIYVGTKILKSYFDIFDSKSCSNEDDCGLHPRKGNCGEEDCKIKCEGNICKYQFKGCDRDVYYYGWGAALRAYNGWGCLNSYLEQDDFVEEISGRYENLANLFVNYLKEDQAVSIVA
ncbi:MAG: transglycosylase SLT domain-containing protein, partial [Nanoarchaeota archaeon]|nr:transglycosylase SLT domain-containing protein [Nanoarchaeota archaeon]